MDEPMIDVAIRFDDPSALSDHALERGLLRIMAEHGVRATFAVVPHAGGQALHAAQVPHLVDAARADRLEIAQHGFSHEACGTASAPPSEFAGADPVAQARRIAAGRAILAQVFGHAPAGFVPPFNTFDRHTVAALASQGFCYLSAGGEHGMVEAERPVQLPRTCQTTELHAAIREARRHPAGRPAIVAVLHHYDFRESGQPDAPLTLKTLAVLLAWLREQPDVRLHTLGELAQRHAAGVWRKAARRSRWVARRHWRLRALFPRYCLMPRPLFNYIDLTGGRL
jgi:peptidoglycan/xylan/chitin deacetylase (PgdA/CDA1 family)